MIEAICCVSMILYLATGVAVVAAIVNNPDTSREIGSLCGFIVFLWPLYLFMRLVYRLVEGRV